MLVFPKYSTEHNHTLLYTMPFNISSKALACVILLCPYSSADVALADAYDDNNVSRLFLMNNDDPRRHDHSNSSTTIRGVLNSRKLLFDQAGTTTQECPWTQLGKDIDGKGVGDRFGQSVSLSADGSILAVGPISS